MMNEAAKAAQDCLLPVNVANAIRLSHQCRENLRIHVREDFEAGSKQALMELAHKLCATFHGWPGFDRDEFLKRAGFEKELKQGAFGG